MFASDAASKSGVKARIFACDADPGIVLCLKPKFGQNKVVFKAKIGTELLLMWTAESPTLPQVVW
jgi:hypothetical protein